MKKAMFAVLIAIFALSMTAMAQDILGPHNVNGHGCSSCHAPHSGGAGNGGTNLATGTSLLWGRDFINKTYATIGGGSITIPSSFASDSDPLFHTGACLSCHDNAVTTVGMTGTTFETIDGVNHAPTYIASDPQQLGNDHPVHVAYQPGTANHNWPGSVSAAGKITWDLTDPLAANFNNVYGHPARFFASTDQGGTAYVECGSCHNPHSMNRVSQTINKVKGYYTSRFFVRGWYDSTNPNSNSATQFCRSCHYSKSNEAVGLNSTTF